jgi:hypothetical protein
MHGYVTVTMTAKIPSVERLALTKSTVTIRVDPTSLNATIQIAFHQCGVATAPKTVLMVPVRFFSNLFVNKKFFLF